MTQHSIHSRKGLSTEMQVLLSDYPRDIWPDHPNFAASIQNWMGAHDMFRKLGRISRSETERFLDKTRDPKDFSDRLSYYGNLLVRNLHGHHNWEDRSFFPELQKADGRFAHGLDTLEKDHEVLDETLDRFTRHANRVVKLIQLDEAQARNEAGTLLDDCTHIEGFLARHLQDEEDLVVPIILHHKLRG